MEAKLSFKSKDITIEITLDNVSRSDIVDVLKQLTDAPAKKAFQSAFNLSIHPYFRDDD